MRILTAGGGSGGHVTPVAAVIKEIKRQHPNADVRFWCDRAFHRQARTTMADVDDRLRVDIIVSGKLRRYHHLRWWQQAIKLKTIVFPNIIDGFKVLIGFVQAICKLIVWRPDVVFTKGGYVCLPIGMAAHVLRIPLVIHDSDAVPGLTNRFLSRWASRIGTGAPLKFYPYPKEIARYIGVPIGAAFEPFSQTARQQAREALGFGASSLPLVVVTGGGLGAHRLNVAVARQLEELLPRTNVALVSGAGEYDSMLALTPQDDPRFQLHSFVDSAVMAEMLGAADVVVARAGATTILELAALAKPTILVPNGFLTGGHQVKNAAVYAEKQAVCVLDELQLEEDPALLTREITNLLDHPTRMRQMGEVFHSFAKPHAARDMAELIISAAKKRPS